MAGLEECWGEWTFSNTTPNHQRNNSVTWSVGGAVRSKVEKGLDCGSGKNITRTKNCLVY